MFWFNKFRRKFIHIENCIKNTKSWKIYFNKYYWLFYFYLFYYYIYFILFVEIVKVPKGDDQINSIDKSQGNSGDLFDKITRRESFKKENKTSFSLQFIGFEGHQEYTEVIEIN